MLAPYCPKLFTNDPADFIIIHRFINMCIYFESKAGKIKIIENGVSTGYSEEEATKILSEDAVTAIADMKMGRAP